MERSDGYQIWLWLELWWEYFPDKVVEQLVRTFSLGGKERTVWDMWLLRRDSSLEGWWFVDLGSRVSETVRGQDNVKVI